MSHKFKCNKTLLRQKLRASCLATHYFIYKIESLQLSKRAPTDMHTTNEKGLQLQLQCGAVQQSGAWQTTIWGSKQWTPIFTCKSMAVQKRSMGPSKQTAQSLHLIPPFSQLNLPQNCDPPIKY